MPQLGGHRIRQRSTRRPTIVGGAPQGTEPVWLVSYKRPERCQVSFGRFIVDYIRWFLGCWQAFVTAPLTHRESEALGVRSEKSAGCWSLERFHFEGLGLRFCFSFQTPIRAWSFEIGATIGLIRQREGERRRGSIYWRRAPVARSCWAANTRQVPKGCVYASF
jgi:hypothetical protein